MKHISRSGRRTVAVLAALLGGGAILVNTAPRAGADTVVTNDGRRITGEVTRVGDGVTVKTRVGAIIEVKAWELKEVIKDAPAKPPAGATGTGATAAAGAGATPAAPTGPTSGGGMTASVPAARSAPRTPGAAGKSVDTLLRAGQDAIFAGDYPAARDAFTDAYIADPRNPKALHGLGLAHLFLKEPARSAGYFQRAFDASGGKPDRALVLNYAMSQIGAGQTMRAVKVVWDYLQAHPTPHDEPMLNALGSSLFLADYASRRNPIWGKAADFYVAYQGKLEAARKGQRRWGVEWFTASDVEGRLARMRQQDAAAGGLADQLDRQELKVLDAKRAVRRMEVGVQKGFSSADSLAKAKQAVAKEQAEFEKLAAQYDAADRAVERPPFPRVLTPVAIDAAQPPAIASAVASAAPTDDPVYRDAVAKLKSAPNPARRAIAVRTEEPPTMPPTTPATPATPPVASATPAAPAEAAPVVPIRPEAGRQVRVRQYACAFAVADDLIVTTAATVDGASSIELQSSDGSALKAELVRKDDASGLALLRVVGADRKLSYFAVADKSAGGSIACACFPTVDLFSPTVELVAVDAPAPAAAGDWTVKAVRHPRLPGSPLVSGAKVVGVVTAGRETPADHLPAVGAEALGRLLNGQQGKGAGTRDAAAALLQLTAIRTVSGG